MGEVARIGSQLKRAMEGVAWHGPALLELLADVSAERAAAKPIPAAHSIWEIVLHVAAWQNFAAGAVEGGSMPVDLADEANWPPVADASREAWRGTVAEVGAAGKRLRDALRKFSDEDLERTVPGREYNFYFLLHGVAQHGLYHAGQVALLKKAPTENL